MASFLSQLRARLFSRSAAQTDARQKITIHLIIRGRIGDDWFDIDEQLELPKGTTITELVSICEQRRIPLLQALDQSPHLLHTLMHNGTRCPQSEHMTRQLQDGDQLYLLAPIAGG